MPRVQEADHRIATKHGRLYARSWAPREAPAGLPALLLFHDSLGCVTLWRDFPEQLAMATQCPVVAYDRLGFGSSDAHAGPLPLTFIQDEAEHTVPLLCDALALARIVPLGHSVGGAMAIATAARWPERCAGVVTLSAQSFVEDLTLAGIRAARAEFEQPGQFERLAKYHGAKARWVLDAWTETWLSAAFAGWNLDGALIRVACPVLAIHGDRDEYGSSAHPQRIVAGAAGGGQAVILDECGHVPHREQPQRVIEAVAGFLTGR